MVNLKLLIKNKTILLLLFISIVGSYWRFRASSQLTFWLDEALIFNTAQLPLKDLILMNHWDQAHPQLYYLLSHFWQKVGTSELFLRVPSLLMFFPSVWLIFKIGQKIWNNRYGLTAATIFSIHYFLINIGYEAKMYPLVILATLASIWSWINIFFADHQSNQRWHRLFIIFSCLAFYADYSTFWYLGALLVSGIYLWKNKSQFFPQQKKRLTTDLLIIGAIISLQLPILITGFDEALSLEKFVGHPNFNSILNLLNDFNGSQALFDHFLSNSWWLPILITLIFSIFFPKKISFQQKYFSFTLLSFLIIPIGFSFAFSQFYPIFVPRNMWLSMLAFIFGLPLVAEYLNKLPVNKTVKIAAFSLICLEIIVLSLNSAAHLTINNGDWHNWKKIKKNLDKQPQPITVVVISDHRYTIYPLTNYYLKGYDNHQPIIFNEYYLEGNFVSNPAQVDISKLNQHLLIFGDSELLENITTDQLNQIYESLNCDQKKCSQIVRI